MLRFWSVPLYYALLMTSWTRLYVSAVIFSLTISLYQVQYTQVLSRFTRIAPANAHSTVKLAVVSRLYSVSYITGNAAKATRVVCTVVCKRVFWSATFSTEDLLHILQLQFMGASLHQICASSIGDILYCGCKCRWCSGGWSQKHDTVFNGFRFLALFI